MIQHCLTRRKSADLKTWTSYNGSAEGLELKVSAPKSAYQEEVVRKHGRCHTDGHIKRGVYVGLLLSSRCVKLREGKLNDGGTRISTVSEQCSHAVVLL